MSYPTIIARVRRASLIACAPLYALTLSTPVQAAAALAPYNVDPSQVTVSGLSSGGYMAMQLGVAYSSIFSGVGIFAGGTYDCAGQRNYTGCLNNTTPSIGPSISNMNAWSGVQNDDVAGIARQRIYLFTGTSDTTVGPNVTNQVKKLYVDSGHFVAAERLRYDSLSGASHTFPTDFNGSGDNACSVSTSPYISNCGFDGAGAALQWLYGTLNPRNTGTLSGNLVSFNQGEFINGNGMDSTGWLYVPAACAAGQACKLHVALHGCLQSYSNIGAKFLNNTGYNQWADSNNIIVLYPQAKPDNSLHSTAASGSLPNPNGCWDWIGWYGHDFDQKSGVQMRAIVAMVQRISSAYSGGGGGGSGGSGGSVPTVPTGLGIGGTSSDSVSLTWSSVPGATSYTIYRDGVGVGSTTSNAYTDTGLSAGITYAYAVSAVNAYGNSAPSATVSATTQSSTPYRDVATATVLQHYLAGRLSTAGYLQLGSEYGYNSLVTLYLCGTTWTNSAVCGPLQ